ncbi:MAG: nucleotide exchange factor GrpE [Candidatus Dependentiae bacterium]|nr:nucleotide exchange factor GrpE [Candidatus Dependentiae bacterium]
MDEIKETGTMQNGAADGVDQSCERAEQSAAISELVQCSERLKRSEEQLRYLQADFENYRRNVEKERSSWAQSAQARVFTDLLTIVDNFERAIVELQQTDLPAAERAHFQGFELIFRELSSLLTRYGVTEIPTDIPFDPEKHEALMQLEASGKKSGDIVDVLQKGYQYRDAVLRPAKVSVAR